MQYLLENYTSTKECNINLSATVIPQNANHFSLKRGQMNTLQAFSV